MILPTTCTVPLCCNLMTKFCRELFKFIFILFCGTMMQCGQIPNLVKLRDAICHNFILSPAAAYLAARIPQRGKLCISWLLPPSQTIPSQYNSVQKKEGKLILESPTFFEVFCTFNTSHARDGLLSAELPIRSKLGTRLHWRQCNVQIIALMEASEVEI